ncbi:hypothetical protein EWM63_10075 [Pseudoduganella lutea]|uniref:Uncharacterized protein n=1 Tax=Pseudoduganella lutea TaxID=321985 RepID=A0A4P6KWU2_9BURK|nr:hypothetical protein EWM63_10075 [Pseudoduganella lutea]
MHATIRYAGAEHAPRNTCCATVFPGTVVPQEPVSVTGFPGTFCVTGFPGIFLYRRVVGARLNNLKNLMYFLK